jgi:hypothetical protein
MGFSGGDPNKGFHQLGLCHRLEMMTCADDLLYHFPVPFLARMYLAFIKGGLADTKNPAMHRVATGSTIKGFYSTDNDAEDFKFLQT